MNWTAPIRKTSSRSDSGAGMGAGPGAASARRSGSLARRRPTPHARRPGEVVAIDMD